MAYKHDLAFKPVDLFRAFDFAKTTQDYRQRQAIFLQGDKADAMFYIQHGNVKLTVKSRNGKKAVIGMMRQGDYFGEGCLRRQSLRISTATAMQPSTIARVKRETIVRIIHEKPSFATPFISYLLFRMGRLEEDFVDHICSSSEKRLARLLLALAGFGLQSKREPVLLKLSQETLAETIGTTRSRVSYFMNRFRKRGFIDYNGSLRVHRSLLTFLRA